MIAALELGDSVGKAEACRVLGVPRASFYRRMQPAVPRRVLPMPARALCVAERQAVLEALHSERFCDKAPSEVYATLLDENIYLCSIRTMHRILAENENSRSAAISFVIRSTRSRNYWPQAPIKFGLGI